MSPGFHRTPHASSGYALTTEPHGGNTIAEPTSTFVTEVTYLVTVRLYIDGIDTPTMRSGYACVGLSPLYRSTRSA